VSLRLVPTRSRDLRRPEDLTAALGVPFSDQQLEAITAPLGPGVIIAGAGSGKTTVMAARVVWLVGTGAVRPEEVLGLTFTRKAAAELSSRVRQALLQARVLPAAGVDESGEQLIMTYDAFAARLVAEHGLRIGVETDPALISGATRYRLASRVVSAAAGPFEFISRLRPATITERVLRLDADLQTHLVSPAALDGHAREHLLGLRSAPPNSRGNTYADIKRAIVAAEERLELASLVTDYQALKARLGVVEFADQMAIAARLAEQVPAVSAALRSTYRVVLLDEYQDTSAAQAIMLRGLFSGYTPSEGMGHPVTAVGDPFQAIYGWRGAASSNILQFARDFPTVEGRPARRYALTINRRSGGTILDVANRLSLPLRSADLSRLGDDEAADGLGLLEPPPATPPGTVRAAMFATWPEEVSWIADQVVAAREQQTARAWADIAVLTRRNADIAPLYGELTAREVPVEIVGLGGLLLLPEVMDVTSTLRVLDDVTANPDLIRLLTGPRWRIGPADLALLGRRAQELSATWRPELADEPKGPDLLTDLEEAVADVDPTEVVSLLDAVESPGELPYSPAARERFAAFAAELGGLRQHVGEPVLDLARRIIATTGLEVELMATPEYDRANRRDQLGAFLDAVASYVDVDGDASLSGVLAYLQAEIDTGTGLEQAVPSDREAVKLLTVHKAKGLEWDVVFLPALMTGIFPSDRVTDNWVTTPAVLPADLRGDASAIPQLTDHDNAALGRYKRALSEEQSHAEDRLAYVAATRARRLLVGSGHCWRADLVNPRAPSTYLRVILDEAERQGELVATASEPGPVNPLIATAAPTPWPAPLDPDAQERREWAAAEVRRHIGSAPDAGAESGSEPLLLDAEEVVAGWDADLDRLLAEARQERTASATVELPPSLSASALIRLGTDPASYAAELARPMPRPPSRAARFGTRFHDWVERYLLGLASGELPQPPLLDVEERDEEQAKEHGEDRGQADPAGEADLRELCEAFARGGFGTVVPHAVEAPFTLPIAGRLVRGRIDAVYRRDEARPLPELRAPYEFLILDWKTGAADQADPLQLALYRRAWAELHGLDVDRIDAAFYDVRSGRLLRPPLPERAEIERLLTASAGEDHAASVNYA
jgi:DNA helicase II / ATP-dependent DNA helicase PcrA